MRPVGFILIPITSSWLFVFTILFVVKSLFIYSSFLEISDIRSRGIFNSLSLSLSFIMWFVYSFNIPNIGILFYKKPSLIVLYLSSTIDQQKSVGTYIIVSPLRILWCILQHKKRKNTRWIIKFTENSTS